MKPTLKKVKDILQCVSKGIEKYLANIPFKVALLEPK